MLVSINVVTLRRDRLVLGWVTICGRVNHLGTYITLHYMKNFQCGLCKNNKDHTEKLKQNRGISRDVYQFLHDSVSLSTISGGRLFHNRAPATTNQSSRSTQPSIPPV